LKITDVIAHPLVVKVDEPFTSARGQYYKTKGACLVEIVTDQGIVGWGDCYGPAAVSRAIIE
jgi:D-galactarolactone cycloisomerase